MTSDQVIKTSAWDCIVKVGPATLDGTVPDELQTRDLFVTPRGNAEGIMKYDFEAEVEQTIPAQGGVFIIARSRHSHLQGIAVWRGDYHEALVFLLPADEKDFSNPLKNFDGLRFNDSPDGLRVTAARPEIMEVYVGQVGIFVHGVGSLSISPAENALAQVPTWRGANTRAGEVWTVPVDAEMDPSGAELPDLILANSTVVATLSPDGRNVRGDDLSEQIGFLEDLRTLELVK